MSIEIRTAELADQSQCLELIERLIGQPRAEGWLTTFETLLERHRGEVLVAQEDGVVLGLATVSYNLAIRYAGEYAQLEELMVDESGRGKNVGGSLLSEAIDRARSRGCAEFGLYLVESTEHNQPFYEKYGFERVGSEMRQRLE